MVRNCGKTPGVSRRFKERRRDAISYQGGYKVHDNVAESVGGVLSFLNCSAFKEHGWVVGFGLLSLKNLEMDFRQWFLG